jgi:hypothetical protein
MAESKTTTVAKVPGKLLLALVAAWATRAVADPPVHGHVKTQAEYLSSETDSLAAALGYRDARAASLDVRVSASARKGQFGFDADYLLEASSGRATELERELEDLLPSFFVDRAARNWLPLDDTITRTRRTLATQSLDRFAFTYTSERWVFKLGRQAYSWGNGIVFRPFDLFDPFAPDAVDTSYKPGIDAVYSQRLFTGGSDVAVLAVPRRDPISGSLDSGQSSLAFKWHGFAKSIELNVLAARDYRDAVLGFGASGALGQAVWRLSLVPVRLDAGGVKTSLVANVEHAWQWRARNVSGFVELFRNGFGRRDRDYTLVDLDTDLVARLARGQVFDTGRDYSALGLRVQWTPLLEVDPVLILNLNDHSTLLSVQGSYSVAQNVALDFGLRSAAGARGSEFGGLRPTAGSVILDAPPLRLFARLAVYF